MSYRALNWAWESELPRSQKFVLVALADMADERESCFPGQERLARMVGGSVSTVHRAVKALEAAGYITRQQRRGTDGMRTSDRYRLNVNRSKCAVESPVNDDGVTGQTVPPHRSQRPGNPQRTTREPSDVPSKRGTRIPEPFLLTAEMRAWGAAEVPGLDLDQHTREFVDHWRAASGQTATKRDWSAAWRNWMRKAHRWQKPTQQSFARRAQENSLAIFEHYKNQEVNHAEVGDGDAADVQALDRGR